LADQAVLKLSRASSVLLPLIYILYLLFHLKSHAYLTKSTPRNSFISDYNPIPTSVRSHSQDASRAPGPSFQQRTKFTHGDSGDSIRKSDHESEIELRQFSKRKEAALQETARPDLEMAEEENEDESYQEAVKHSDHSALMNGSSKTEALRSQSDAPRGPIRTANSE
jgi:Ca2+/H+ antiporter